MKKIFILIIAAAVLSAAINASAVLVGDANGDGKVNNKDVTTLFRYVSGINAECFTENCDVNGDRSVVNKDTVVLFRKLSGKTGTGEDIPGMSYNENENEDSGNFGELFG